MQFKTKMVDHRIFIKYSDISDQPPLLMLMGYSGTTDSWTDEFLSKISGFRTIVAIDLPGTGRSTRDLTVNELSYEANIKDIESVLTELGIEQFHLLGYSYGGTVAMSMMNHFAARLQSVVLVATTLGGRNYVAPPMERLIALGKPAGNTVLEKTATIWKVCLGEDRFPDHQKAMVDLLEKQGDFLTPGWVLKEQLKNYMQFDFSDSAVQIKTPVLVVTGAADPLTPVQNSRNISRLFANSELVEFEDGRHMPHLEFPDQFAEAVLGHLSQAEKNSL